MAYRQCLQTLYTLKVVTRSINTKYKKAAFKGKVPIKLFNDYTVILSLGLGQN